MKKIIDGKRYDTDTAAEIARHFTSNKSESNWADERLFRTKRGNWFLFGEGYADSRWCTVARDGMRGPGGWDIQPIAEEEALAWLERHGETDLIEQYFEVEEA